MIWFFNNNGWIDIVWLGYDIRIDILTFLLCFILFLAVVFLLYRFYSFLLALILGVFGIFKASESKRYEKEIEKYETVVEFFTAFTKAINDKDLNEARSLQKKIDSLLQNEELKNEMLIQIEKESGKSLIINK